ncbi:MAG: hypothetical protein HYT46_02165, partial [Candidatus Vogelbacteria bacterium]|nr:hypothetical protein [Candidatus Vogelbacteria bacterium]
HIISVENLLGAWRGLVRGKRHKPDVQAFTFRLMDNILLKVKHYLRYADDFVLLSPDRGQLIESLSYMGVFLHKQLKLILHPDKVSLKTLASGVDYLGNDLPDYLIFALLLV